MDIKLERAAYNYAQDIIEMGGDAFRQIETFIHDAFRAGANWQKEGGEENTEAPNAVSPIIQGNDKVHYYTTL